LYLKFCQSEETFLEWVLEKYIRSEYEILIIRLMIFFHRIMIKVILIVDVNDICDDESIDLKAHW
jgi:hypothetical protein